MATTANLKDSLIDVTLPSASVDTLMGIPFRNISFESARAELFEKLNGSTASETLFFINSHCLNISFENTEYRNALRRASLVFPDGSGVAKGCSMLGGSLEHNLNGTDLFPLLCKLCAETGRSLFLLGADHGTAEQVGLWAEKAFPGLQIAGTHHGFFRPEDEDTLLNQINHSGADVLLVAMGVPLQELWLDRVKSRLHTRLNLAVGGLFEFYSGNIPRAPLWMRERGIEWIWRFLQEPSRMWRRYLLGNPLFYLRMRFEARTAQLMKATPFQFMKSRKRRLLAWSTRWKRWWFGARFTRTDASKRMSDVFLASGALIALLPLFVITSVMIKLDSPGPVFFRQTRVGQHGRPFLLWKFRSMVTDAEARRAELEALNEKKGGVTFKITNDPRVTRVGTFIRKFSIDELPQLVNVLKGDMSIVGPRPGLYSELSHYELVHRQRLDVKPGLTSEWVVAGRNDLNFEQQAQLDIQYRNTRGLFKDVSLMFKTIPVVFTGRGAS